MLVFPGCKWLLGSKCVSNNHLRPWKINMEPTNHPFRKENDLPNLHDYVQNVNLLGCRPSLGTCSSYSGSATTSDRDFVQPCSLTRHGRSSSAETAERHRSRLEKGSLCCHWLKIGQVEKNHGKQRDLDKGSNSDNISIYMWMVLLFFDPYGFSIKYDGRGTGMFIYIEGS